MVLLDSETRCRKPWWTFGTMPFCKICLSWILRTIFQETDFPNISSEKFAVLSPFLVRLKGQVALRRAQPIALLCFFALKFKLVVFENPKQHACHSIVVWQHAAILFDIVCHKCNTNWNELFVSPFTGHFNTSSTSELGHCYKPIQILHVLCLFEMQSLQRGVRHGACIQLSSFSPQECGNPV